jgi:CRP/FNR family transcriptional regulator, anaerobic regulatory protein
LELKEKLRANCSQCMLSKLCLPAGIDQQDLARLVDMVRANVSIEKDSYLVRSGQTLNELFVVSAGALKTVVTDRQGVETLVAFHLPGELVGLDALASGIHQGDCIALADARVCKIPMARLEDASQAIPGLQRQLLRLMGRCMQREQNHSDTLAKVQAMERVARFLLELEERYRAAGLSTHTLQLPMSRQDIASFLGIALETVSRNLSRLQEERVIDASGRRIQILNLPRLFRFAQMPVPSEVPDPTHVRSA